MKISWVKKFNGDWKASGTKYGYVIVQRGKNGKAYVIASDWLGSYLNIISDHANIAAAKKSCE